MRFHGVAALFVALGVYAARALGVELPHLQTGGDVISSNIDVGQIIISCALAIIAWEGKSVLSAVKDLRRLARKHDRRLMHLEEWASVRFEFKRRPEDTPEPPEPGEHD